MLVYKLLDRKCLLIKNICLIKNKPFPIAHIESVENAIQSNARWALLLDADILLKENAIESMISEAEKITSPFFQYNFRILDRGFCGETYGVHLYSVKSLNQAIQYKEVCLSAQRPENQMCYLMAHHAGIPSISSQVTVALHGYEQYYSDLYRTTFVRAIKYRRHQNYMFSVYREYTFSNDADDLDYKFMFWGLVDGMIYGYSNETAPLDSNFYQHYVQNIYRSLKIKKRTHLLSRRVMLEKKFSEYEPGDLYLSNKSWICPTKYYTVEVPDKSINYKITRTLRLLFSRLNKTIKVLFSG